MNKKLIIAAAVASSVALYSYYKVLSSEIALFELFPDTDRKVVIKAHRTMLARVIANQYGTDDLTDERCTEILQSIIDEIQK